MTMIAARSSPPPAIQSIGPPPEKHADRVVAAMLRDLVRERAVMFPRIAAILQGSKDGNPAAQKRMVERITQAGAIHPSLHPGKRGKYKLSFWDIAGWDVATDSEITIKTDPLPEKPWLCCGLTLVDSPGHGQDRHKVKSVPFLMITHHLLSRAAQRLEAKTTEHFIKLASIILAEMIHEIEKTDGGIFGWAKTLTPAGKRITLDKDDKLVVVLQRYKQNNAIVAMTIFDKRDKP